MRIHRLRRDDEGAVAIVVALVTLFVLLPTAAFSVDFGSAYVAKRNLSNGVDAAALSAAQYYGDNGISCANAPAASASARPTADQYLGYNANSGSVLTAFQTSCSGTGSIVVAVSGESTSPRSLGAIFGSGPYGVQRSASAELSVAPELKGVRPYAACSADVVGKPLGSFVVIKFPSSPGCGYASGNSGTTDCPDSTNNGNPDFVTNTINGCTDAIYAGSSLSPCVTTGTMPNCLGANTGGNQNQTQNAWDQLKGKIVVFPVFNDSSGSGNNGKYPVIGFVAGLVCGYKWRSPVLITAPECFGATYNGTQDQVVIKLVQQTSGDLSGTSTCIVGDTTCDFGVRRVRLIN